jgi:hypothetical protein
MRRFRAPGIDRVNHKFTHAKLAYDIAWLHAVRAA